VRVDVVPRLFELLDGARTVDGVGGMTLLSISAPALSRPASAVKRGLDIVGAALGLIALAPLCALIAAAVKLDSPGPVLFRQSRTGRGGRTFVLYKFRSMRAGSGMLVSPNGALLKAADDDRITRVGRLLRRCSLDEAPQLFNVLRGDMSLVGPRPLVAPEADALCESWHRRRADVRPGLTGLWQISGRSLLGFEDMIRLDFEYVTGWSLGRDLEILTATVPAVLSGRGAR
jgi:lipopolysaccharide/colanic/teichoic acid biosynthesis glycosyltransferase